MPVDQICILSIKVLNVLLESTVDRWPLVNLHVDDVVLSFSTIWSLCLSYRTLSIYVERLRRFNLISFVWWFRPFEECWVFDWVSVNDFFVFCFVLLISIARHFGMGNNQLILSISFILRFSFVNPHLSFSCGMLMLMCWLISVFTGHWSPVSVRCAIACRQGWWIYVIWFIGFGFVSLFHLDCFLSQCIACVCFVWFVCFGCRMYMYYRFRLMWSWSW